MSNFSVQFCTLVGKTKRTGLIHTLDSIGQVNVTERKNALLNRTRKCILEAIFFRYAKMIPVNITTGFYVANVVARYWDQVLTH